VISLSQYLNEQPSDDVDALLEKHGFIAPVWHVRNGDARSYFQAIRKSLEDEPQHARTEAVLSEIARTQVSLRQHVYQGVYEERWYDLRLCLQLDGYMIADQELRRIEPDVDRVAPLEDDLTTELSRSGLADAAQVIGLLNNSADDFPAKPS
jgi:hypothetical protein